MSDFMGLQTRTAAEWREEARASRKRSAESWERSDTDGFMSQWANDVMASAYNLCAELRENGDTDEFFGARDIATGVLVPGKWLNTRYGSKWAVFATDDHEMKGDVIHWLTGGARSMKKVGLEAVRVRRPVIGVRSSGSQTSVSYYPVPGPFSPSDTVISTWAEWEESASVTETATTGETSMSTATYAAPAQGFNIGDTVRIGKGKAIWTVVERFALGEYTLESEKGARRKVTRETDLIGIGSPNSSYNEAVDILDTVKVEIVPESTELQEPSESAHADYPHSPGYLYDCNACENGPCVCSDPCNDPDCISSGHHAPGAIGEHLSPCMSNECQRAEYEDPCPVCGDPIDYCQGHGAIGDPEGYAILAAEDESRSSGPLSAITTVPVPQPRPRTERPAPNRAARRKLARRGQLKPNGKPNLRFA